MYIPDYSVALLGELDPTEVVIDYSMYVGQILRRKHYGKMKKYRR